MWPRELFEAGHLRFERGVHSYGQWRFFKNNQGEALKVMYLAFSFTAFDENLPTQWDFIMIHW